MRILDNIFSPEDLLKLTMDDLKTLSSEVRREIVSLVSKNGGHLSSNLGSVESTIALLRVFGDKSNSIIWDVGHQCYTYKILTGRKYRIHSLRKKGGLSGFTNPGESDYDLFKSGHAGNSISLAVGVSKFKKNFQKDGKVIVYIGDGSMTCGLSYEGLNNSYDASNLVIILNDNSMSISKNVGSISKYLSKIRTSNTYLNAKKITKKALGNLPFFGKSIENIFSKLNLKIRTFVSKEGSFFENLGFRYYGPVDGHDISKMIQVMNIAKKSDFPVLIHIVTEKGRGYSFAEKNPEKFHGISKFDIKNGTCQEKSEKTFSEIFGEFMCKCASKNKMIYAITAAMEKGTGLSEFAKKFPNQFCDVGIAESHAVSFAAGLSAAGYIPIFAVYSTFLQRSFDQLIHDVSMQNLKVVFAVDRAGFVGEDGESHQGIFDIAMFNSMPNVECYSPAFFDELESCLSIAISSKKSTCVRYPKGTELFKPNWINPEFKNFYFYGTNKDILLVTYGRIFSFAAKILDDFPEKISILKLNMIIPVPEESVLQSCGFKKIVFFEESYKSGSISEKFAHMLLINGFKGTFRSVSINGFVKHASMFEQLKDSNLDYNGMLKIIDKL